MKPRTIIVAIMIVAAVVGSYGVYSWGQRPATTTTAQDLHDASTVLGSEITLTPWQTVYFTTQLPSYLRLSSSNEDASKPIIGSYVLASNQSEQNDQVAVTVGKLGNLSLSELSYVKLRANLPATYKPVQLSYAPAGAIAFSRLDSYETSVFWQSGTRYVAVVVSGTTNRQPDLDDALRSIVSNWQWR